MGPTKSASAAWKTARYLSYSFDPNLDHHICQFDSGLWSASSWLSILTTIGLTMRLSSLTARPLNGDACDVIYFALFKIVGVGVGMGVGDGIGVGAGVAVGIGSTVGFAGRSVGSSLGSTVASVDWLVLEHATTPVSNRNATVDVISLGGYSLFVGIWGVGMHRWIVEDIFHTFDVIDGIIHRLF